LSYSLRKVMMPSNAASVSAVIMASTTTLPALTASVMSLGRTPAPSIAASKFLYAFSSKLATVPDTTVVRRTAGT
jgi:hypothetical protein